MNFIKNLFFKAIVLTSVLVGFNAIHAQTSVNMFNQSDCQYLNTLNDVSTWGTTFPTTSPFLGLATNATGTVPSSTRITTQSTTFSSGTSGGVQKGTNNICLLSTGTTDNTTSTAFDMYVDYTNVNADILTFNWSELNNATGNRCGSLRVYVSTDSGTTFTQLGSDISVVNNVASSGVFSASMPAAANNNPNVIIRFYYYNGNSGGTACAAGATGSRPKICIDNVKLIASGCCPNLIDVAPVSPSITNSVCTTYGGTNSGGSISAVPSNCPTGSTLQYSTDNVSWSTVLPTYNQAMSITVYTRCNCDLATTVSSPTEQITTVPGSCPLCPDLTSVVAALPMITNSTCPAYGAQQIGGSIIPAISNCPAGSTLQYSTNGTTWSTSVPVYDQDGPPQQIQTRCNCDGNTTVSSTPQIIMTNPGQCPPPVFTFTVADPCSCNNDQGADNTTGEGSFNEVVTINGAPNILIRIPSGGATGLMGVSLPAMLTQTSPGTYSINFNHQDRTGYNITLFQYSIDGGLSWLPVTDALGTQISISNVCAYPIIAFDQLASTYCSAALPVTINSVFAGSGTFTPLASSTVVTVDGVTSSTLPTSLSGGTHAVQGTYTPDNGAGINGTVASPATATNASSCPVIINQNVLINKVDCTSFPW